MFSVLAWHGMALRCHGKGQQFSTTITDNVLDNTYNPKVPETQLTR